MAVDACSESSIPNMSPHVFFSLDHHDTNLETLAIPSSSSPLDLFPEFDFMIENSIKIEPFSSADELFSHGRIRSKQIEPKLTALSIGSSSSNQTIPVSSISPLSIRNHIRAENSRAEESLKEIAITSEPKSESKSFWRIDRSSSLHCDNSYKKCSFWSLPLLVRSNSTGSVPYTKLRSKKVNKEKSSNNKTKLSAHFPSSSSQRPPLNKKNGVKYNGGGVPVSPILNVHPSTYLFGLGSLFSNRKNKKGRK